MSETVAREREQKILLLSLSTPRASG